MDIQFHGQCDEFTIVRRTIAAPNQLKHCLRFNFELATGKQAFCFSLQFSWHSAHTEKEPKWFHCYSAPLHSVYSTFKKYRLQAGSHSQWK